MNLFFVIKQYVHFKQDYYAGWGDSLYKIYFTLNIKYLPLNAADGVDRNHKYGRMDSWYFRVASL